VTVNCRCWVPCRATSLAVTPASYSRSVRLLVTIPGEVVVLVRCRATLPVSRPRRRVAAACDCTARCVTCPSRSSWWRCTSSPCGALEARCVSSVSASFHVVCVCILSCRLCLRPFVSCVRRCGGLLLKLDGTRDCERVLLCACRSGGNTALAGKMSHGSCCS
jgi:hypothetical protein